MASPAERKLGAALGGLAAANVLLGVGLNWYAVERLPGSGVFGRAASEVALGQVILVGFWLALGDGKWYWRLALAVPVTMCIGYSRGIAAILSRKFQSLGNADEIRVYFFGEMFFCLGLLLTLWVLLLPVRRLCGYRLTWQKSVDQPRAIRQFSIGDFIIWISLISAPLVLGRFLASLDAGMEIGLRGLLTKVAALIVVLWLAMLVSLPEQRHRFGLAVVLGAVLFVGSGFAVAEYLRVVQLFRSVPTARSWTIERIVWQSTGVLLSFTAASVVGLVNCLIVRALECRLVRPKANPTKAEHL